MPLTLFVIFPLATICDKSDFFQYIDVCILPLFSQVLIDWINDVLVEERIIVKQLEEDLYDGQVLQKLLGELMLQQGALLLSRIKLKAESHLAQRAGFLFGFSDHVSM